MTIWWHTIFERVLQVPLLLLLDLLAAIASLPSRRPLAWRPVRDPTPAHP